MMEQPGTEHTVLALRTIRSFLKGIENPYFLCENNLILDFREKAYLKDMAEFIQYSLSVALLYIITSILKGYF